MWEQMTTAQLVGLVIYVLQGNRNDALIDYVKNNRPDVLLKLDNQTVKLFQRYRSNTCGR